MTNDNEAICNFIADVWHEIDSRLRIDDNADMNKMLIWMNILGIFQEKVEAFGLNRKRCGIPDKNADELYILLTRPNPT